MTPASRREDTDATTPAPEQWPVSPDIVRRQVRFIVDSVVRPEELDVCEVVWMRPDGQPESNSNRTNFASRQSADGPPHLWLRVVARDEEWWFGTWHRTGRMRWREFLGRFADELTYWASETSFAWGEQRPAALPEDHAF